ncbi:MAG: S16 family serine protease, partial [archaeon]|nr:S16 family serine protease [archaeon]
MKFRIIFLLCLLFSLSLVSAITEKDSMKIYAVTSSGGAVSADLTLELRQGSGNIWSDIDPLVGTSTQSAEKTAIKVAKNYSKEANNYDFYYNIDSTASIVEGPSAGAAMALIAITALQGKDLPSNVSMTGTISEDGKVGPVGGVFEKSKEAANTGIKLFMIPLGEGKQTVKLEDGVQTVYLPDYAEKNWNIKVVEVSDIDEVLKLAFTNISEIDVNSSQESVKEYTPEKIEVHPSLAIMKKLSTKYIEDANVSLTQARNSLSSTLIDDSATLDFLLSTLNSADKSLFQARELNENNYLYSAANLSFLAKVYTSLVKDVAENPSLLSSDSTLFDIKLNDLKNEIKLLKSNLNQNVPIDFL